MQKQINFIIVALILPAVLFSQSNKNGTSGDSIHTKTASENTLRNRATKSEKNNTNLAENSMSQANDKVTENGGIIANDTFYYTSDTAKLFLNIIDKKHLDSLVFSKIDSVKVDKIINVKNKYAIIKLIQNQPPPAISFWSSDEIIYTTILAFLLLFCLIVAIVFGMKLRKANALIGNLELKERTAFGEKLFDFLQKKSILDTAKREDFKNPDVAIGNIVTQLNNYKSGLSASKGEVDSLKKLINENDKQIQAYQKEVMSLHAQIENQKNSYELKLTESKIEIVDLSKMMVDRFTQFKERANIFKGDQEVEFKKLFWEFHVSYTHISLSLFRKFSNQNSKVTDLNISLLKAIPVSPTQIVDNHTETGLINWIKMMIKVFDKEKINVNDAFIEGYKVELKD